MSYGFHAHPRFRIVGAADAQLGKPSSGPGSLDCNATYALNMGVTPEEINLGKVEPQELKDRLRCGNPTILIACAPCTGFSRTNSANHLRDDPRNSLVRRTADFVEVLKPKIFLMENARELLKGNFTHHFELLRQRLECLGYKVHARNHVLDQFGLPQKRERALVIAVKKTLPLRSLEDLWCGHRVREAATHVRAAIGGLPPVEAGSADPNDPWHVSPKQGVVGTERLLSIPHDGGSWVDLVRHPRAKELLTPAMKRYVAQGKFGSHPDVYGRLWWDRPAVTIKRECGHTGNGRYAHPDQDRLCTVREMAILQGFPKGYLFAETSVGNMYRHIGDAVPPLISYQIAWVCDWILSGERPSIKKLILKGTHLRAGHIRAASHQAEMDLVS